MNASTRSFLEAKVRALRARAGRLARLTPQTVGIRRQDVPFAPDAAHFRAANLRLAEIDREVRGLLRGLDTMMAAADTPADAVLRRSALVERAVDRARRTFGLYFEIFGQRGTAFAPALHACDSIAGDCFALVRQTFPELLGGPLLKPITYVEASFSPATFRRGVMLRRLLGERNPFPLVRVPHERLGSPWGFGVVLHEVGHSLQADLQIWQETEAALRSRVLQFTRNPWLARIWTRWHKEIFADLAAILLGGPAAADGMKDFLAYPAPRVLAFRPLAVHPVPYLRAFIMAEMIERLGFGEHAARVRKVWDGLYGHHLAGSRLPQILVESAPVVIPEVVDEVAFQTRRGLAGHRLVDILPFTPADERRIRTAAQQIASGRISVALPPRFTVGAARYALEGKLAPPDEISRVILTHLNRAALRRTNPSARVAA